MVERKPSIHAVQDQPGGLEVPSSNLGAPIKKAPERGLFRSLRICRSSSTLEDEIVFALGVAVSAASAGEGNPPNPRKLCTKGNWEQWTGLNGGQKFKSEDKCLNYVLGSGASARFFQTALDCDAVGGAFGTVNLRTASAR